MSIDVDDVVEVVRIQLGVDEVRPEHRFQEDLAAESADVLNIVAVAEDRWGVVIDEEELADLRTIADLLDVVRRRARRR